MIIGLRYILGLAALLAVPCTALAITEEEAEAAGEEIQREDWANSVQEPEAEEIVPEPDAALPSDTTTPVPPTSSATTPAPDSVTPPAPTPADDKGSTDYNTAILQGLNKVTARAQELEAPLGSVTRFGTIEIIVHKCWKSAPSDRPENAALLEVSELKQNETPQRIFSGWMFSSTPGISSLEHPFYDITVVECKKADVKP